MKARASRLIVTNEMGAPAKAAGTRARAMRSRKPAFDGTFGLGSGPATVDRLDGRDGRGIRPQLVGQHFDHIGRKAVCHAGQPARQSKKHELEGVAQAQI